MSVQVEATGSCLPRAVLASSVLEKRHGLAAGTVAMSLGVRERRIAAAHEATSDLAVAAAGGALSGVAAGGADANVGLVLVATSTPDHITPATAPLVAHRLGLTCAATDVANTCAGWVYALAMGERWLRGEPPGTRALVVGANVLSRRVDWGGDWRTAALFGDGAGAVVLKRAADGAPPGILATALASDGAGYANIQVTAGGSRTPLDPERFARREHLLRDAPKAPLKDSIHLLGDVARRALATAGWKPGDVDAFVPHQAGAALVRAAAQDLGIADRAVVRTLEATGNTSAASIPIALDAAARDGRLREGSRVLVATVAAGMTAGAGAIRWTAGRP